MNDCTVWSIISPIPERPNHRLWGYSELSDLFREYLLSCGVVLPTVLSSYVKKTIFIHICSIRIDI